MTTQTAPAPATKPAYKHTPLGWIPEEWDIKQLIEIANYVDYRGKTPPKKDSGKFLVTAKNIKSGYIDYQASQENSGRRYIK